MVQKEKRGTSHLLVSYISRREGSMSQETTKNRPGTTPGDSPTKEKGGDYFIGRPTLQQSPDLRGTPAFQEEKGVEGVRVILSAISSTKKSGEVAGISTTRKKLFGQKVIISTGSLYREGRICRRIGL